MGIYTQRGFEYLVIVQDLSLLSMKLLQNEVQKTFPGKKIKTYPIFNAISVIDQNETDDRLQETEYFTNNKDKWFCVGNSCIRLVDEYIPDFEVYEEEMILIDFVNDFLNTHNIIIESKGWYDVNHVSTTYELPESLGSVTLE